MYAVTMKEAEKITKPIMILISYFMENMSFLEKNNKEKKRSKKKLL